MNAENATVCTLLSAQFIAPAFILQGCSVSVDKYLSYDAECDKLFPSKIHSSLITYEAKEKAFKGVLGFFFFLLNSTKFLNMEISAYHPSSNPMWLNSN